ncbi:MAG: hypothetical protein AMXMBFR6_06490 [Betaproteobacteria bacterium]
MSQNQSSASLVAVGTAAEAMDDADAEQMAGGRAMESATCRWARRAATWEVIGGKGRHLANDEVFFGAAGRAS